MNEIKSLCEPKKRVVKDSKETASDYGNEVPGYGNEVPDAEMRFRSTSEKVRSKEG
jgi:hypothetical protein